jgi:hypothetical protein
LVSGSATFFFERHSIVVVEIDRPDAEAYATVKNSEQGRRVIAVVR